MSLLSQMAAVSTMNLRSIPQRLGSSLVIVIGIAGVVAVLISVLSMATGFRKTIANSGRADRVIVLSRSAESEAASNLSRADVQNIATAPGVKKTQEGKAIASADALIVAPVARKSDGSDASVTLRGVGPEASQLRPEIKLVAGRMFQPAVHELIVGRGAQLQFVGLDVGDRVTLRGGDWTVVGVFTSGDSHESELLADANTVLAAYRQNTFKSYTALLESPQSFDTFKDALTTNPTLTVDVKREPEYFANVSRPLNDLLELVAYVIGGIMAVGALFGALNTMYSAVSARSAEIATLRAIGFAGSVVVASVFVEALLLALSGAVLGVVCAYLAFNGDTFSTIGGAVGNSQLVYSLAISPQLMAVGMALATAIGLLGGLFPAIRAARAPVAATLRAI